MPTPTAPPSLPPMVPGAEALRDIYGIQGVPWWPLAPGWWWLAGGLLVLLLILYRWRPRRPATLRLPPLLLGSWRGAAARELRALRRRVSEQPAKQSAGEFSELLRRIAMARLGRAACAGLTGPEWLRWLRAQDPNGFDWEEHAQLLLAAPYAPPNAPESRASLPTLIAAAEAWISATPTSTTHQADHAESGQEAARVV